MLCNWQESSLHEIAVPDVSLCMQDHMSVFCWVLWRWESVHISPKEETAILQGRWLDEKWPFFTLINGSCRRRGKKTHRATLTFEHYVLCSDVRVAVIHSVFKVYGCQRTWDQRLGCLVVLPSSLWLPWASQERAWSCLLSSAPRSPPE